MSDFERRTADTLRDCAKWLDGHADELAHGFCGSMGCQGWSVRLDADTRCAAPVTVSIDSAKVTTIDYRRD